MKMQLTALAATLALATPLWAQTDTDGDGNVTIEEAQAANPNLTAEDFATADTDADGVLNADEVDALVSAGLLPG
jgi:hypothetical protein